ncbi:hypothetical protein AAKU52_000672 [Pedobacter sp. CG_S7]|uniref:hypothetical protein n=1 Tax=Pedobacter sp. CG_S7 TaxID=3143930 RepID=UPI003394E3A6
MKRRFTFLVLSFLLLLGAQVNAQTTNTALDKQLRNKFFISAHAATQGLGLELKYAPIAKYNIRVGASILPIKWNAVYNVRSEPTDLDLNADFANAHLMLDWHPFINETSFSRKVIVTAGAAYFWKAQGDAVVTYRGVYNYGDIEIPSADLGQLMGSVKWNKVAPYLGIGFENPYPTKKFNIGFAIGAYYMGEPDVSLTGTKFLVRNQSNEAQFRKNMSNYTFMPVVQINLNFALN